MVGTTKAQQPRNLVLEVILVDVHLQSSKVTEMHAIAKSRSHWLRNDLTLSSMTLLLLQFLLRIATPRILLCYSNHLSAFVIVRACWWSQNNAFLYVLGDN